MTKRENDTRFSTLLFALAGIWTDKGLFRKHEKSILSFLFRYFLYEFCTISTRTQREKKSSTHISRSKCTLNVWQSVCFILYLSRRWTGWQLRISWWRGWADLRTTSGLTAPGWTVQRPAPAWTPGQTLSAAIRLFCEILSFCRHN